LKDSIHEYRGKIPKIIPQEVNKMTTCKNCKSFFPLENNPEKGDCVQRAVDPRQAYYKSKPVNAADDAVSCSSFQKK